MQQLFASGKMAMNVAGPYTLPEYVDAKVDYGVASMPSFGDEHTTIAGPDTWAILDNGEDRVQAALEFMDWFSEPEQQLRWISEAGSLPLTNDVQDANGYSDYQTSLPGLEKFIENTEPRAHEGDDPGVPADLPGDGQGGRLGAVRRGRPERGAQRGGGHGEPGAQRSRVTPVTHG